MIQQLFTEFAFDDNLPLPIEQHGAHLDGLGAVGVDVGLSAGVDCGGDRAINL